MAVLEKLTEEECYLVAILQDSSGLDLAEFTWFDPERKEDGCWRAWPFQWMWFRCVDGMQLDQCARSVGKSLSIKLRAFVFAFIHPNQEMVITAPEKVHLDAITDIIETQLVSTRLTREMLTGGRGTIKHQPFHVNFVNGSRIMGRIPQRDGKGVKGIHPIWLEADEMQDYPKPGWDELIETLKYGFEGAVWRAHGVTRGVRDEFYKHSQPESDFTVHCYTAMHRPTWTHKERLEKIKLYGGSKDHPTYRRNVRGLHGDLTNPLFVLHRLMKCVDHDEASDYNQIEYQYIRLNDEMVADYGDIVGMLDFNAAHREDKYLFHWIGMDVGYTVDPSEILVFGEYKPKHKASDDEPKSKLRLLTRVHLERIRHEQQVRVILWMIDYYRPRVFAMDKTGLGLPLFQDIQDTAPAVVDIIRGYNFSEKILVDFDQSIEVDEWVGDPVKEAGIKRNVREYAQDCLRDLVDVERIELPWDLELLAQFQGGTQTTRPVQDQYGRRRIFSAGDDHALDGARMAALGFRQYHIEELLKNKYQEPVFDVFMS